MATSIFDKPFSDHVVFDRIVDADRNIALARQAADKAEADGKPDKAAVLRAKADQLEALLNATKQPTYDDVDETESQGPDPTKTPTDDGQQGKGGDGSGNGQAPDKNQDQSGNSGNGSTDGAGQAAGQGQDQGASAQERTGSGKTPDDISNIDQNSGSHANGTLKNDQGGPGSSSGSGSGSGGSGGNSQGQNQNNNGGNSNGSGKSTSKQKELDPFRRSLGGNNQQGEQPTPQQILDAIIKRLSGLSGNAKVGADRALQQLYDELGGSGAIDD
jgi:hypothetical protein